MSSIQRTILLRILLSQIMCNREDTKSMDMQFHWLRCRDAQGQFRYYWRPGTSNLGDFWTKNHPSVHHKSMQPAVLTPMKEVIVIRERNLTRPMCHLQTLGRYLAKSKILARTMKLIIPTASVCYTGELGLPTKWDDESSIISKSYRPVGMTSAYGYREWMSPVSRARDKVTRWGVPYGPPHKHIHTQ